ncbi:MAG: hypothetical protein OD918_00620 [Gammaproteobacteria bacterium]
MIVSLGKNAFVAMQEVFASVDTVAVERRLANEGRRRGAQNRPGAQADRPDADERGIVASIAETARQTRAAVQAHFEGFLARLREILATIEQPDALIAQIQGIRNKLKMDLNEALDKFKGDSQLPKAALSVAEKSYAAFRRENDLKHNPQYDKIKNVSLLFGFLVALEALVSSSLLWGFLGVIPAFFQTALITVINVVFLAWMFGTLFRWKNLFHNYSHLEAWIYGVGGTALGLLLLLTVGALHLGVGHYRDAIVAAKLKAQQANLDSLELTDAEPVDLGFLDYAQQAMQNMKSSLFGIDSIQSWLLCLAGLVCFIVAAYKWYSAFDPYPGYRARHRDLVKQHAHCKRLENAMRKKISRQKQDADKRVSEPRTRLMTMRTERDEWVERAPAVRAGYDDWVVVLNQKQNQLLAIYREANEHARSEPAPDHFNREVPVNPQLTEAPAFSPPDFPESEVTKVLASVDSALQENQQNYDGIREEFNKLAFASTKPE